MRSLLNASLLLLAAPIAVLSAPIPVLPRQDASSLPADTLELLSSSEGQSVLEAFMQWQAWQAAQSASDAAAGQEGSDLASSESSTDSPADGTSSDVASTEPIPGADDGSDNASASLDDTGAGRQPLPGDALHAHDIPVGAHPLADAAGDAWDMALVHHEESMGSTPDSSESETFVAVSESDLAGIIAAIQYMREQGLHENSGHAPSEQEGLDGDNSLGSMGGDEADDADKEGEEKQDKEEEEEESKSESFFDFLLGLNKKEEEEQASGSNPSGSSPTSPFAPSSGTGSGMLGGSTDSSSSSGGSVFGEDNLGMDTGSWRPPAPAPEPSSTTTSVSRAVQPTPTTTVTLVVTITPTPMAMEHTNIPAPTDALPQHGVHHNLGAV